MRLRIVTLAVIDAAPHRSGRRVRLRSDHFRRVIMAISGPLKVDFGDAFPFGLGVVGPVEAMRDFDASTPERPVQARDKDTGQPIWQVDVMDFDPNARERTFKVKIVSPVQPVPPAVVEGTKS